MQAFLCFFSKKKRNAVLDKKLIYQQALALAVHAANFIFHAVATANVFKRLRHFRRVFKCKVVTFAACQVKADDFAACCHSADVFGIYYAAVVEND